MNAASHRKSDLAIQANALSKSYAGSVEGGRSEKLVQALCEVSFEVRAGERVSIVGRSGSGKSTLLSLLGALDKPTSGTLRLSGIDVSTLSERARTELRRHQIGFVFQFFNLLPTLSAAENVMLPAILSGCRSRDARRRALQRLDEVGLTQRADHRPYELSGGEMQRVAIARALVMNPPLLLADEPTGNLDSETGEAVLALLTGVAAHERTVVLVTHDPSIAARLGREVGMQDGRVAFDRTTRKDRPGAFSEHA
jgi:putative ABC transport system ATP-binding protein